MYSHREECKLDDRTRDLRILKARELMREMKALGFDESLASALVDNLRTENTMDRMIGYLKNVKPRSEELVVDEMLAIMSDRDAWVKKKEAEYYNSKYNELLYYGLGVDEE